MSSLKALRSVARPRGRCLRALAPLLLATTLLIAVPVSAGAATVRLDRGLANELVALLNETRAEKDLRPLKVSKALTRAAHVHAVDMGNLGYFSHSSADGRSSSRRITSFYSVAGANSWKVGEVLLWSGARISAEQAVQVWLTSPPHRRELLGRQYREVGVGAVRVDNAPGVFGGRSVTIVVMDFGRRS